MFFIIIIIIIIINLVIYHLHIRLPSFPSGFSTQHFFMNFALPYLCYIPHLSGSPTFATTHHISLSSSRYVAALNQATQ
jgi:hypothetical protein